MAFSNFSSNVANPQGVEKNNAVMFRKSTRHPFHLVNASPWPFLTGFSALVFAAGSVLSFHYYSIAATIFILGFISVVTCSVCWWRDVIVEGFYNGDHSEYVQNGLKYGMILFIVSEILFFAGFFWAFFHSSLAPAMEIGFVWPPKGIKPFCPFGMPTLNTLILLASGVTVTWAHHKLESDYIQTITALVLTVGLGLLFTVLQYHEYAHADFKFADGIYACAFYLLTGFHGFHVIVGTIFLIVCLFRVRAMQFRKDHHVGFMSAIWYWHFVDIIWIFLFIVVYIWGGRPHA